MSSSTSSLRQLGILPTSAPYPGGLVEEGREVELVLMLAGVELSPPSIELSRTKVPSFFPLCVQSCSTK